MEEIIEWFRANPDVFGFFVAALIFITTIFLVAFRVISFWITLLLLIFALFSGITIANQQFFKDWMRGTEVQIEQATDD